MREVLLTIVKRSLATAAAVFLPARDPRVDMMRLALAGVIVTGFFLFTSPYTFPGGADHFTRWAEALAYGTKLNTHYAQRDVGFPLLILLSGYTLSGSFIGITLIHAAFAILMPILVYLAVYRLSRPVALLTAACTIVSFAPIYYMKMIHHDQTYIFFTLLTVTVLVIYLQTRSIKYLYFFTAAALAASISRPAGNILFPIFLGLAYITARGRLLHYAVCAGIFCAVTAGYFWHRYEIFDMAHQPNIPSYTGEQIFYNVYMNSDLFGVPLSPDLGPNLAALGECLRKSVQPSVREAPIVKYIALSASKDFMEEYFYKYTPDELAKHVFEAPNREYNIIFCAPEGNDKIFFKASFEVLRAYPWYILAYTARNMMHLLARPGYSFSRYNANSFGPVGLELPAATGGVWMENTSGISARATREVSFQPLSVAANFVVKRFNKITELWDRHYHKMVMVTLALMILAWLAAGARFALLFQSASPRVVTLTDILARDGLTASILAASLLLLYNFAVTAAFVDPDYRYHNFMVSLRILTAGYGLVVLVRLLGDRQIGFGGRFASTAASRIVADGFAAVRRDDAFAVVIGRHPRASAFVIGAIAAALFIAWSRFMVVHTW